MQTAIIGIDCSAQWKKVGLALATSSASGLRVEKVAVGGNKKDPLAIAAAWARECTRPLVFALDAPLGWPDRMARELACHRAGVELNTTANRLFRRATDDFIHERLKKRPLDVGADRIARTAHAALRLLGGLRDALDEAIPMAWDPTFQGICAIEVYPAATLKAHGIQVPPKKNATTAEIHTHLVRELGTRMQILVECESWLDQRDAIDAMICALAAYDFLTGQAMPPDDQERAEKEGWIWARDSANSETR